MVSATYLLTIVLFAQPAAGDGDEAAGLDFFEKRVRPVLVERCFECHSSQSKQVEGGLWLDSREAVLRGGDSGAAAVVGEADKSRLIEAVRYKSQHLQMPPQGKLPAREIEVLQQWVARGLPFTPSETIAAAARRTIDIEAGRRHWAFQPLIAQPLPEMVDDKLYRNRIDAFVHAELNKHALTPSTGADRRVLVRRASFDLLGLPPTPEEAEAFIGDEAPDAYARLIERLLASPHYGERWARYWLDLVRYCDVTESWRGGEAQPWLYRDWVIAAFNKDLPYDDFVRQQLAADLLPGAAPADNAALGFLGISPTYWKELKLDHTVIQQVVAEEWEERIEAVSGTFLGLTVACARCHDHKFDPITTQDYYALAGVLSNVRLVDLPTIEGEAASAALTARAKAKSLQEQLDKLVKGKEQTDELKQKQAELREQINQLRQTSHFDSPLAPGISDERTVVLPDGKHRTKIEYDGQMQDVALHIRGNATNLGPVVPRRYLAVLSDDPSQRFSHGSGRRELAEAIVTDSAPLAARVIVNRVWAHHFGRGLITTLSNFGTTGEPPSHPQLLDDLAARFVAAGWSIKWLHREIMLSATYRQSSYRDEARHAIDPDNVWLWRMRPRRLDVEAWRDAMLATTGELERSLGGPPHDLAKADNRRRTIYGQIKRRELNDLLRLHDFPDPVAHSATRINTTTPLQQLYTLNGPLLYQRSVALQARLFREAPPDMNGRVQWLCRRVFGRDASNDEVSLAERFVSAAGQKSAEEAWRQYCHALLASNELLFVE